MSAPRKNAPDTTHLILLAHGSSDPAWQIPFRQMSDRIAARQPLPVTLAFMELCSPSLEEIAAAMPDQPCRLEILPLFFSAGRHLRQDVPEQIRRLHQRYPHLHFELHDPVGFHPKMTDALADIAADLDLSAKK